MKKIITLSVACIAACLTTASWAQSTRAWRCPGNYYTDSAEEARKTPGCKLVEGGNVTVIRSSGSGTVTPTPSRNNPGGGARATPSVGGNMQVPTNVQQSRDNDARTLLERELSNKQSELTLLQSQYNNGHPEKLLSEVNDEALYQARVTRLSREIELKASDIASIQNEMSRLR